MATLALLAAGWVVLAVAVTALLCAGFARRDRQAKLLRREQR